jgi:hypothetical protein
MNDELGPHQRMGATKVNHLLAGDGFYFALPLFRHLFMCCHFLGGLRRRERGCR